MMNPLSLISGQGMMGGWGGLGSFGYASFFPLMLILIVWSIFWKGWALWHAAGRREGWWFIALLVINTAGILEIVYLFAIVKVKLNDLLSFKV